jgi:hypothetical protein
LKVIGHTACPYSLVWVGVALGGSHKVYFPTKKFLKKNFQKFDIELKDYYKRISFMNKKIKCSTETNDTLRKHTRRITIR